MKAAQNKNRTINEINKDIRIQWKLIMNWSKLITFIILQNIFDLMNYKSISFINLKQPIKQFSLSMVLIYLALGKFKVIWLIESQEESERERLNISRHITREIQLSNSFQIS